MNRVTKVMLGAVVLTSLSTAGLAETGHKLTCPNAAMIFSYLNSEYDDYHTIIERLDAPNQQIDGKNWKVHGRYLPTGPDLAEQMITPQGLHTVDGKDVCSYSIDGNSLTLIAK